MRISTSIYQNDWSEGCRVIRALHTSPNHSLEMTQKSILRPCFADYFGTGFELEGLGSARNLENPSDWPFFTSHAAIWAWKIRVI